MKLFQHTYSTSNYVLSLSEWNFKAGKGGGIFSESPFYNYDFSSKLEEFDDVTKLTMSLEIVSNLIACNSAGSSRSILLRTKVKLTIIKFEKRDKIW